MPIYTYRCTVCNTKRDVHHGFDDTYDDSCKCGGRLAKVLQLSGVAFKGNGFYRTDNSARND